MLFIFDMGGVVTTTASIEDEISKILNISKDDFIKYCKNDDSLSEHKDLISMCSSGIINTKEFWKLFYKNSGIKVTTDWLKWIFHPVLNKETVNIIGELKKSGHRIICATNTIDCYYRTHIERGDYMYFDQTYASCFMGVSKPDHNFWKIILKAEQCLPQNAFFIDDREENCNAAAGLGIKTHIFTNSSLLKNAVKDYIK